MSLLPPENLPAMYDSLAATAGHPANYVPLTPLSFLARTAEIYPHYPSLSYHNQHFTWQQTEMRCQQMAHALQQLNIRQHETVSVLAFNTPEMFEAHFFVPLAGAVLNTINTRLDSSTISYILEFAESTALIVDRELLPQALDGIHQRQQQNPDFKIILIDDPHATSSPDLPANLQVLDYNQLLADSTVKAQDYLAAGVDNELNPLSINFTSGTSGNPKAVVYHHRGSYLMSMGTIAGWPLPQHPVYLYTVPMFHCNGWGHVWTMTAMAAQVICIRSIVPEQIFELIQTHHVSHFGGAPIVLNMLAGSPACPDKIASERKIFCMTAGAPPPAAVLERMEAVGFEIMHVYGLTETYGHILQAAPQNQWQELEQQQVAEFKSRQGVRFPMTETVRVLNPETLEPVAADGQTMGEIVTRGNTTMSGYLKHPEATAESFRAGWFWSGDLAVVHSDGYIQVRDRAKDIIISGGENISSVEIENTLYKHPAVGEAAVVAMPDEKWGETPCAFIEAKEQANVDEQELIEHCKQHLAGFKKPGKVIFGPLPKTATGKIQKYELRKRVQNLTDD